MNELVYFPGFEIVDENWLKFALLYLEKLHPIVPSGYIAEREIESPHMKYVVAESDLIEYYSPTDPEVINASNDAIDYFSSLLNDSEKTKERDAMIARWKIPEKQSVKVRKQKYTSEFMKLCVDEKLARKCEGGALMSKDLSFTYMSFLANSIASEKEIGLITDSRREVELLHSSDMNRLKMKAYEIALARSVVEFTLPSNLRDVPLKSIVALRNEKSFQDLRKAFMNHLQQFVNKQVSGEKVGFKSETSYIHAEIADCIYKTFKAATPVALTVLGWFSLQNEQTMPGCLEFGLGAFETATDMPERLDELKKAFSTLKQKNYSRKYLVELSQFK
ncbi:MAG: hypothetical protein E7451_08945 [Ruminococcaceae bacterium]|nr:hypothetical protein [Oscillospiraceae bacterium]